MRDDKLQCGHLHLVTQSADLYALPNNAVVLESHLVTNQPEGPLYALTFPDRAKQYDAVGANFGQDLHAAGCCRLKEAKCNLQGNTLAHSTLKV